MLIADEVVMQPGALGVGGAFMTLRKNVRRHLGAALARLPGDVRALTGALVLGDRSYLGSETVDSFRRGGLSHVLALSGMHLGIVAGSLLLVLRRFFSERGAMVAALAVAWGYLLLVGPGASLLRAAMMFSLWALFRLLDRRAGPLNSLGLTFLFFALFAPERSGEVGFWFSFLALSGLLLAGPPLGRFLERWLPPVLATPIGVSAAAFLATAPLSLALFGFAAPAGIFASVILGPLVVLVLWGGLLLLSSAALGFLFLPGYWITAWLQSLLLLVVETAASGPPITVDSAAPASWATALLPLIAIAAIALRQLVREARFRRTVEEEALLA
jgi:competence protein ComEC